MTTIKIREHIYEKMISHLETACTFLDIGDNYMFHYEAGKADACREILEELFYFDERYASEHIKNMWEIIDESW